MTDSPTTDSPTTEPLGWVWGDGELDELAAAVGSGAYTHEAAAELGWDRDRVAAGLELLVAANRLVVERTHAGWVRRFVVPPSTHD